MKRTVWKMADYVISKRLFVGYASTVYKARCKLSGETVCIKVGCQAATHARHV